MNNLLLKSERGFATLIALLMVGMLTLLGIAALSTSDDEVNIAGNSYNEMRTFYAAEAHC
jgi:Tfp pilus assembly protein PilX